MMERVPSTSAHTQSTSLRTALSDALPLGFECTACYIHTPSRRCDPLFSTLQGHPRERTRLASHFLTISVRSPATENGQQGTHVLAFGVEALVYSTKSLTTIFVSKADSTGYLTQQRPSPIKPLATAFLCWLVDKARRRHPHRTVVISLFARSQSQYLFPGSAENLGKHILDDRQLVRWWVQVLDPLFHRRDEPDSGVEYDGYITIPGYTTAEVRHFLPPGQQRPQSRPRWQAGNPLHELAAIRGLPDDAPPRCLLPRFPDDPKARFMQDLDDEIGISGESSIGASPTKRKTGQWSSVRDVGRFWEAMEFRQECSSGRLVGFLWLMMRSKRSGASHPEAGGKVLSQETVSAISSDPAYQEELSVGQRCENTARRKLLTGPIVPRQPRLKGGSSSLTAASDPNGMLSTEPADGLVMTKEGYDSLMQTLLNLEFRNVEAAQESTSRWVGEAASTCGVQENWGLDILGTASHLQSAKAMKGNDSAVINDLGGLTRKRKADCQYDGESKSGSGTAQSETRQDIHVLDAGVIRKRPKAAAV